uniref:RxLR effector candidate protein n=1 Tax=Peronospora matthiolae TaxID=2874970 RepID=A0AAV1TJM8_9STRA
MKMPFRSFEFLASIAVVTHITGAAEIARPLMKGVNMMDNDPLSVADLSDAPANNVSRTHNTTLNEDRMTGGGAPALLCGVLKNVLFDLYRTSKNVLTPAGQRAVITADEELLKRAENLLKVHDADKDVTFPGESSELAAEPLEKIIQVSKKQYFAERLETMKNKIVEWMQDQPPSELLEVLDKHGFFEHFSFADVHALSVYLDEFNAEWKTAYPIQGTLLRGFGGAARYASFLSVARQSPITGNLAAQARKVLLETWQWARLSIDQVAIMLELSSLGSRGITYESLDTFFQYGDINIGLRQEAMVKHNKYAEEFEKDLAAQWVKEKKTLEGVRKILEDVPDREPSAVAIVSTDTHDIMAEFGALFVDSVLANLNE